VQEPPTHHLFPVLTGTWIEANQKCFRPQQNETDDIQNDRHLPKGALFSPFSRPRNDCKDTRYSLLLLEGDAHLDVLLSILELKLLSTSAAMC